MFLGGSVSATNTNVLSGSLFEFVRRPSRISVGLYGDGAINTGNLFTFQIGDTVIARDAMVYGQALVTSGMPESLRFPDHFWIQNEPALAGDRLVLAITRASGNIMWAVMITEVA